MSTVPCPHCGGDILADAHFCKHCGSSDADGWKDEFDEGLEDEEFDYDSYVDEHHSSRMTNTKTAPLWRFAAVILLVVFTFASLLALFNN